MNLLILSNGYDTGAVGSSLKAAFERHTDWSVRFVRRKGNFLGYQPDIEWPHRTPMPAPVREAWAAADVVHMMEVFVPADTMPGYERKPRVIHHLGDVFRRNAAGLAARARSEGIAQLACSFDLVGPGIAWLPLVCDTERMRAARRAYRPGPRPRLMQTPAARIHNHTDAFLAALGSAPVDVELIEGLPWPEAVARKAQADILFDSFDSWYGLSAIEAWAMGVPVIGGPRDDVTTVMEAHIGPSPMIHAEPAMLDAAVEMLLDPGERRRAGEAGRAVVERHHAEARVVERLLPIYEAAMDGAVAA